ncbi:MAG: hypothetical protein K5888_04105 [Lachnospiraceae bacterium]|nr:hypothetical protein [Lachnospiraceae bacterium]
MENKLGIYCSRTFADWMLNKNTADTDYPATSFHRLIRMYCRTNYKEFFDEEERKGTEFRYRLIPDNDRIRFESSYEVVFLPYKGFTIGDSHEEIEPCEPEPLDKLIFGYRILQTRGFLPGSTQSAFWFDAYSMDCLVNEIVSRSEKVEKFAKKNSISIDGILKEGEGKCLGYNPEASKVKWIDSFRAEEFQRAEERMFIDNEWPFSVGPSCPDRIICLQMYTRIICELVKEADRLGLVPDKDEYFYELRTVAYAAALLSLSKEPGFSLSEGVDKKAAYELSEEIFEKYHDYQIGLDETCRKIKIGLLWDLNVEIDRSERMLLDYDDGFLEEAPIGLTPEDYDKWS